MVAWAASRSAICFSSDANSSLRGLRTLLRFSRFAASRLRRSLGLSWGPFFACGFDA